MKKVNVTANRGGAIILFLVKLGFRNLNVAARLVKARRIITLMTGNPNFATPVPSLATITTSTDALEAAEAAMDGSRIKTVERDTALQTFDNHFKQLQSYVEITANGNTEIILSSGFEVRNPATRPTLLPAPQNLIATNTDMQGQIKLKWNPVKGAKLYGIEIAIDVTADKWDFYGQSTKAGKLLDGFESGKKQYFRVVAFNTMGPGAHSEIAEARPN